MFRGSYPRGPAWGRGVDLRAPGGHNRTVSNTRDARDWSASLMVLSSRSGSYGSPPPAEGTGAWPSGTGLKVKSGSATTCSGCTEALAPRTDSRSIASREPPLVPGRSLSATPTGGARAADDLELLASVQPRPVGMSHKGQPATESELVQPGHADPQDRGGASPSDPVRFRVAAASAPPVHTHRQRLHVGPAELTMPVPPGRRKTARSYVRADRGDRATQDVRGLGQCHPVDRATHCGITHNK